MINLTTNVEQNNIRKWSIAKFDSEAGTARLVFESNVGQTIRVDCILSNEVNKSVGAKVNATPDRWDDRIVASNHGAPPFALSGGVGAANSLDSARTAYVTAYAADAGNANSKHKAGLKAIEVRALVDGWVEAALTGT